jgi:hypothetical protein
MTFDDDNQNNKSKHSLTGLRKKSTGRSRNQENEKIVSKTRSKRTKTESKQPAQSKMATRNRRK